MTGRFELLDFVVRECDVEGFDAVGGVVGTVAPTANRSLLSRSSSPAKLGFPLNCPVDRHATRGRNRTHRNLQQPPGPARRVDPL